MFRAEQTGPREPKLDSSVFSAGIGATEKRMFGVKGEREGRKKKKEK